MAVTWIALIGWDVVQDVRGTVGMMLFIMEEAIQTAMMAQYIAVKEELWPNANEVNAWTQAFLATPLLELSNSVWAKAAYPLDLAYYHFADATLKSLAIYRAVIIKNWKK